jgi:hypothetical protein
VMIPHASHIFFTDQPEASYKAIQAFLAEQGSRAGANSLAPVHSLAQEETAR